MCYFWQHREELQYGLEWMLSMWIWRLENEWKDIQDNSPEQHVKMVTNIFDDLAACSEADMRSLYADETSSSHVFGLNERVEWKALWAKYEMTKEGRIGTSVSKAPVTLRSFS